MESASGKLLFGISCAIVGYCVRGIVAYMKSRFYAREAELARYEASSIDAMTSHDKYRRAQALKHIDTLSTHISKDGPLW